MVYRPPASADPGHGKMASQQASTSHLSPTIPSSPLVLPPLWVETVLLARNLAFSSFWQASLRHLICPLSYELYLDDTHTPR